MRVLLTGASGFVGSHILECLLARDIPTVILLRQTSRVRFIEPLLHRVEVRRGSITDAETLDAALEGVTHVLHSAGSTKAHRISEFYEANQIGTRNVIQAVNRRAGVIQRVVHISSLAACHPATANAPAREEDEPAPVSEYGRSKLLAEREVRQGCAVPFVILRPCAVYGPRDADFLLVFKSVRRRILPVFAGGRQELSLVFVQDLAEAAVRCLSHPQAGGKTYGVAHPAPITTRQLLDEIARQLGLRTMKINLPAAALRSVCSAAEMISRIRGRPGILSRQKCAELLAPGWVCSAAKLEQELGFVAKTAPATGIQQTLEWYRKAGWLR